MIPAEIEKFTKDTIFSDLSKGNPTWDVPHTTAVVHYVKEIIKANPNLNLDPVVLVLAAYAHDWGYSQYYRPGEALPFDEYMEAKKTHAAISAQRMAELLKNQVYDTVTVAQKARILHLVTVHDKKSDLKDADELVLMEADTLGGLDVDFAIPSFDEVGNSKYMKGTRETRLPLFITDYSKKRFEVLFKKREEYYINLEKELK